MTHPKILIMLQLSENHYLLSCSISNALFSVFFNAIVEIFCIIALECYHLFLHIHVYHLQHSKWQKCQIENVKP